MPKKLSNYEKEFLKAFAEKAIEIKEKIEKEKLKEKEKTKTELKEKAKIKKAKTTEKEALIEKKLRPSIREEEKKAMAMAKTKLKEISLEGEAMALPEEKPREEKIEKEKIPAPKPTPTLIEVPSIPAPVAPIYQRPLPPLPKPPKLTPAWPLPPPPKPKITKIPLTQKPGLSPIIDLDKLNTFIQDASINMIQCNGANLPIKIKKEGKLQETVVTLTEDEIKTIIKKFADRTNQPISEPIFKTQIGNIAITAIISSYAGSKFVIYKT